MEGKRKKGFGGYYRAPGMRNRHRKKKEKDQTHRTEKQSKPRERRRPANERPSKQRPPERLAGSQKRGKSPKRSPERQRQASKRRARKNNQNSKSARPRQSWADEKRKQAAEKGAKLYTLLSDFKASTRTVPSSSFECDLAELVRGTKAEMDREKERRREERREELEKEKKLSRGQEEEQRMDAQEEEEPRREGEAIIDAAIVRAGREEDPKLAAARRQYQRINSLEAEAARGQSHKQERVNSYKQERLDQARLSLILFSPSYALAKRVPHKLWMGWYRQIDARLKAGEEGGRERKDVAATLEALLDDASAFFQSVLLIVDSKTGREGEEQREGRTDARPEDRGREGGREGKALRVIRSQFCTALGDLERYRELHLKKGQRDWGAAIGYYTQALRAFPSSGHAHNQIAVVALHRRDLFAAVVGYVRAICAQQPFPAEQNLLALFERNRQKVRGMEWVEEHGEPPVLNAKPRFLARFVRLVAILWTKIDMEKFDGLLQNALGNTEEAGLFSDGPLLCQLLVLVVAACERALKAEEQALAEEGRTDPRPSLLSSLASLDPAPSKLSPLTSKAISLLLELFSAVLRAEASNSLILSPSSRSSSFLPSVPAFAPLAVLLLWSSSPVIRPALQQQEAEFFRVALAQFLNSRFLTPQSMKFSLTSRARLAAAGEGGGREGDTEAEASLQTLRGFLPFDSLPSFRSARRLDLSWQAECVREGARSLLHFTPTTQRWSAFAGRVEAVAEEERAELMALLQVRVGGVGRGEEGGKKWEPTLLQVRRRERRRRELAAQGDKNQLRQQRRMKRKERKERERVEAERCKTAGGENERESEEQEEEEEDEDEEESKAPKTNSLSPVSLSHLAIPVSRGVLDGIDVASLISEQARRRAAIKTTSASFVSLPAHDTKVRHLFILDAPNIAMRHGRNKVFSVRGVHIALGHLQRLGHRVLGFLPEFYLDYEYVGNKKRARRVGFEVRASLMPDNVSLLRSLRDEGLLECTPAQDYDDSYCIEYAVRHGGYIISNDKYRDHLETLQGEERRRRREWLKSHLVTFTFVGDEFLPNPDAMLHRSQNSAS